MVIDRRFNGPPDSGQGGYVSGLLANAVGTGCVEVTLRLPPPLERKLLLEETDSAVRLLDGDSLLGEARPSELDLEPPLRLSEAEADAAREAYPFHDTHPFPTCFGCGPERDEGDGLRMFAGPVDGHTGVHATTWTPDPALATADGTIPTEIVWAALDCPSSSPVANPDGDPPVVLGRFTARLDAPVHAGVRHTAVAWLISADGRKRTSGVAIHRPDGELAGVARALWIEMRAKS